MKSNLPTRHPQVTENLASYLAVGTPSIEGESTFSCGAIGILNSESCHRLSILCVFTDAQKLADKRKKPRLGNEYNHIFVTFIYAKDLEKPNFDKSNQSGKKNVFRYLSS